LPLVLFRGAENAFARAEVARKQNNPAAVKQELTEASKRYEEVIARFPEFDRVSRARYGLGLCHIAAEDWEKAATILDAIPAPDRNGDLAGVSFVLADCLIRTAPAKAEDALQDNILREKLGSAAGLLEGFVGANPKAPEAADALLKLGYCMKRLGSQYPPGNERNDALNKSRAAYERLAKEYPQSPLLGAAALERAKVLALQGDRGSAINSLRQFAGDPLQKSPVAPLAYITLATLLREQNQAPQAVQALQEARQKFEGQLGNDPERKEWVHLLRYHHGVALFEAGKSAEARQAFEQVIQGAAGKPIGAEAALRACQCLVDEGKKKLDTIQKELSKGGLRPEQLTQFDAQAKAAKVELVNVGKLFEHRADEFKAGLPQSEARARMLYDAAWTYRALAPEAPLNPAGRPRPLVEDPTAKTDPFVAELLDHTRKAYQKLIAEFPSLSMVVEARLELAELQADYGQPDEAAKLFKDALDAEPTDKPTPPETAERIRVRLGVALFAKKDYAAAQAQFDAVAGNEKSPHRGAALYRTAECLITQGKWEEAKNKLVIFRDNGAYHNIPGVSDRAILRLGNVLTELKQWDAARQAFESLLGRYGDGNAWATDARYGIGWVLQNQGRFDEAVNQYSIVTQKTHDDRAGRSHLQIGLCRAAQKRWDEAGKAYSTVYYGYDLPDLRYAAMVEHARALGEQQRKAEATKLLERVIKEAPKEGPWVKAAQEMLDKVKK
jgi:tetratricopeptide (TPR) repeat protein